MIVDALVVLETESAAATEPSTGEQVIGLIVDSTGPVFVVVWVLIVASIAVWFIAILKLLQLRRMSIHEERFEHDAAEAQDADQLFDIARHHGEAPGVLVVFELQKRRDRREMLEATAKRALVTVQKRTSSMLPTLASIGSAAPFVGLFGTVYGIMDAFLRIGREKSASLPVVAPAIGEALVATAIGLFAAIPAVIAYNAINKRMEDLMSEVEASAEGWVALIQSPEQGQARRHAETPASSQALPLARPHETPPPPGR